MNIETLFTDYYRKNTWLGIESRSGLGSSLAQTVEIRKQLPTLIRQFGVKSLLDLPCGDYNWMKLVSLDIEYTGADIVRELIDNNQVYSRPGCQFVYLDLLTSNLPTVDLILCRDCLGHFSFEDIKKAVANMCRSKSTYLLTTTFTERKMNWDIETGQWRPINLQISPFNFPAPLTIINEKCPDCFPAYADKSLGLWRLE